MSPWGITGLENIQRIQYRKFPCNVLQTKAQHSVLRVGTGPFWQARNAKSFFQKEFARQADFAKITLERSKCFPTPNSAALVGNYAPRCWDKPMCIFRRDILSVSWETFWDLFALSGAKIRESLEGPTVASLHNGLKGFKGLWELEPPARRKDP